MKIIKMFSGFIIVSIIILLLIMIVKNSKVPSELGVKNGKLAPMPISPNAISSQTEDAAKKIMPLKFVGSLEESKTRIKDAIKQYGGYYIKEEKEDYMHIVFTTGMMKFNDDVELFFDEDRKVIHYRSASRVGYSDMGLNKERYEELANYYYSK